MKNIANIILVIGALMVITSCSNRGSVDNQDDTSRQQAPVLENPETDTLNQIDSSSDTSKTIVENIADRPDMATLTSGIESAELIASLSGPGPFTVFAPTDSAFKRSNLKVRKLQKAGPDKKLQNVLVYHIVSGFYTTDDLKAGLELSTVQGQKIRIGTENGNFLVNGTPIILKNIIAKNGVIHVIDSILTPPDTVAKSAAPKK